MRRGAMALLGVALIVLVAVWGGRDQPPAQVDPVALAAAIDRSNSYLLGLVQDDGRLRYRFNLDPSVRVKKKYNVVRHAGSIYALVLARERRGQPGADARIIRATRFLASCCLAPVVDAPETLALWSDPSLTGDRSDPREAKLGSAGLGLVAFASAWRIDPGVVSLDQMRRLGRFLLWMQKPDGSFHSKYVPSRGGRNDDWISLYYPGEAALGLMALDAVDPQGEWAEGAARALGYLAQHRAHEDHVLPDHWALIATAELLPRLDGVQGGVTEAQLRRHTAQVLDTMLGAYRHNRHRPGMRGSFNSDGRAASTATYLEGLLAAASYVEDPGYQRDLERAIADGIAWLLGAQITQGEHAGAVTRAIRPLDASSGMDEAALAKFNRRATEVRIDYVQHSLTAWIQYEAWRQAGTTAAP